MASWKLKEVVGRRAKLGKPRAEPQLCGCATQLPLGASGRTLSAVTGPKSVCGRVRHEWEVRNWPQQIQTMLGKFLRVREHPS